MKWNKKRSQATLMITIFLLSALTITSLMQTPVKADPPLGCPEGITHYWKLDETDDTCPIVFDDFVDGVDGGCSPNGGPTPTDGQVNGAQMIPGGSTGQGIDVPADSSFDWGASDLFSIEFWFYRPGSISVNDVAIGRDDGSTQLHWWIGVATDNKARAVFADTDGGGDMVVLYGISSVTDGRWYHIAVVRDSTHMRLYVNGVEEDAELASFSSGFDSATAALNIGWLSLDTKYTFDGKLDEVAMYNRDLSENEVKCHYTLGLFEKTYCESTLGICDACPEPPETLCDLIDPGTTGLSLFGTIRCGDPNVIVGQTELPEIWRGAAGTFPADWIDATAAAGLWFLCEDGVLYWDHDSTEVNQATGETQLAGHEIMSGGPLVNAPVKYYEGQKLAPVYYKASGGFARFFDSTTDTQISGALIYGPEIGPSKDMFVIQLFQKPGTDADPEYVVLSYGFAGRGTLAASVYFKTVVEPNLETFTDSYYIVQWDDTNGNAHPDIPGTDTYTPIASGP